GFEDADALFGEALSAAVVLAHVDAAQVIEHAQKDRVLASRQELVGARGAALAVDASEKFAELLGAERLSGERIEQERALALGRDQKVTRKRDAAQRNRQPARDFDHDDRERDRNAQPALEDLVQEAVARVFVFGEVAVEALFFDQKLHERRSTRRI